MSVYSSVFDVPEFFDCLKFTLAQRKDCIITLKPNTSPETQEQELKFDQPPRLLNLMSIDSNHQDDKIMNRITSTQDFQNELPFTNQINSEQNIQTYHEELTSMRAHECSPERKPRRRKRGAMQYKVPYKSQSKNESNESEDQQQTNFSPCNCQRTHCLKLYCLCFHKNQKCSELCKCVDCQNNEEYSQTRTQALEQVKVKQQRMQYDEDLFDLSRVWGCCCQKSKCQKNYCECFNRNQRCSAQCKCDDCQNKKKSKNKSAVIRKKVSLKQQNALKS